MNTRRRAAVLTVIAALVGVVITLGCTHLLSAERADASGDHEALTSRIAEVYNASMVRLVENEWNNRTDVEMVVNGQGYNCLMPTEDDLKNATPLTCKTFVFLATEV